MKNLKKKFGKFAISTAQVKQIKGGYYNCTYVACPKRNYLYQPEPGSPEYECCKGN
ncbi:hypothetical protein V9L05_05055 [Bernardetia sp. Wsw4-3y2]|uniref:hypothetical protein n=1 Tax=unclassified Bernardetia TaxID=2647129 RepID=UPI0030D30FB3